MAMTITYILIKALHLGDDIDRLYVLRKGGRGLTSIKDGADTSIQGLH